MSFQTYLESVRAKPEHVRTRYAFLTSFGITAIIATFWIGSFTPFGSRAHFEVATALRNAGTPAQSLVAGVGSFFNDIKDIIFGPKKVVYSSVEVTPGKR